MRDYCISLAPLSLYIPLTILPEEPQPSNPNNHPRNATHPTTPLPLLPPPNLHLPLPPQILHHLLNNPPIPNLQSPLLNLLLLIPTNIPFRPHTSINNPPPQTIPLHPPLPHLRRRHSLHIPNPQQRLHRPPRPRLSRLSPIPLTLHQTQPPQHPHRPLRLPRLVNRRARRGRRKLSTVWHGVGVEIRGCEGGGAAV